MSSLDCLLPSLISVSLVAAVEDVLLKDTPAKDTDKRQGTKLD